MFFKDYSRESALNAVESHAARQESLAIVAEYGIGKTELLKKIKKDNPGYIKVNGLGNVYQILASMAKDSDPKPANKMKYFTKICATQKKVYLIDEGHHLPNGVWRFFKEIMDSGNSLIIVGLPIFIEKLKNNHPDALSRFTRLRLDKLGATDLYEAHKLNDVETDAFDYIYSQIDNAREILKVVRNCRDYAKTNRLEKIDLDLAMEHVKLYRQLDDSE